MLKSSLRRLVGALTTWCAELSYIGAVLAILFFAASLTPSLLPRHYIVQGILSGLATTVGYSVGVFLVWLWHYLGFRDPPAHWQRLGKRLTAIAVTPVTIGYLWRATIWQNSIRSRMAMELLQSAYPIRVVLITLLSSFLLLVFARFIGRIWHYLHERLHHYLPRRVSYVLATCLLALLLFMTANHVVARFALSLADTVFSQIDEVVEEEVPAPTDTLDSGGPESNILWDSIGLQGKHFIALGPQQADIEKFWSQPAKKPLRIYVGLRSRPTPAERAKLALEELIRTGGFERSALIIATPTGTGWLDPGAVDTVEYMHRGDTAIVSMQYSYLPSWITILVDPQRSRVAAHILFDEIYAYWKTLPKDKRPRLYLHGLSLGALGSETSADMFNIFEDPIHGAVWSGPPFPSIVWNRIIASRNPGSPMWQPTFRDGSILRFTGRENAINSFGDRWAPMRFVYIQHASDPMVFFSPELLYRKPDWLNEPRGPDVSPHLRWYPIVTFLQTAFDLPMATSVPHGYGHNYDPTSYIDAWTAVTAPAGWSDAESARLKELFLHPPM